MQKKRHSLLEACVSTGIGFGIALLTTAIVLPLSGFQPTLSQNIFITSIFTLISVVRGYFVRRLFNWLHFRGVL